MDYSAYEHHIDFVYTTLLMIWGGSCIGVGLIVVPFLFSYINSKDEASNLTTRIFKRLDYLIRVVVLFMVVLFYFKSKLTYSYQHIEWVFFVIGTHCFIFGKFISKKMWKLIDAIQSFDELSVESPMRKSFKKWHRASVTLFSGQIVSVLVMLYLHAFGL
ncbi:MAG: DUF4149 domain-containing protein [Nitrospinota bacterium]